MLLIAVLVYILARFGLAILWFDLLFCFDCWLSCLAPMWLVCTCLHGCSFASWLLFVV